MKFEVTIPQWSDGRPVTIHNIESDTGECAKQKARPMAPDCPLDIMIARPCRCNECAERDHEEFLKEIDARLG